MLDEATEDKAMREAVSAVLQNECTLADVRKYVTARTDLSAGLWRLAGEQGWLGIAAPEAYGGSALEFGSLAAIYQELGRHLAPIPFLQIQLCIDALIRAGTEQLRRKWLESLVTGSAHGAVSMVNGREGAVKLTRAGTSIQLSGKTLIADDGSADLIVVFAHNSSGELCALGVECAQAGIELATIAAYDGTRALATVDFAGCEVPAHSILAEGDGAVLLHDHLVDHAAVALACDSIGGASAIFDITVEYLKNRKQFGRPIGSFQALKHRCATLKVGLEASRAILAGALHEYGAASAQASAYASLTKFHACDTYLAVSADSVQLHGGIGFTWEGPCHLFLKRAKLNQALFGNCAWHQDRAMRLLLSQAV